MKYDVQNIFLFLNKNITEQSLQTIKHSVMCSFRKIISVGVGRWDEVKHFLSCLIPQTLQLVTGVLFHKGKG